MKDTIEIHGNHTVTHRAADGTIKSVEHWRNTLTNEGKDYILNAALHGGTAISTWYYMPMIDDYTISGTETYASHGFTEATTQISETTRQEWQEGASSGQSITNATKITITAASTVTIYGGGLCGGGSAPSTKNDSAGGGTLLSVGKFSTPKSLTTGETLEITCTLEF